MTPTEERLALLKSDYDPIPARGKNPGLMKKWAWQKIGHASPEQATNWSRDFPDANNTGVLCRRTPFLDADILDPEAVRDVEELVRERYEDGGYVLPRIGKSPKRAFPFRTDEPFLKISVPLIAANGDSSQKIEFLCDGQQCVVLGIHPETRKPYSWPSKSLIEVPRGKLPYIRGEEAQQLVNDIVELLVRNHGYHRKDEKSKKSPTGNGGASWDDHLDNLIDHDELTKYAMSLLRAGMSDGAAVNLLRAQVERLQDVDPDRRQRRLHEIPGMVSSARAKIDRPEPEPGPKLPVLTVRRGWKTAELQSTETVVIGLLHKGSLTLIYGIPKSGKSFWVTDLFLSVASAAAEWMGQRIYEPGPVLYIACEGHAGLPKRNSAAAKNRHWDQKTFPETTSPPPASRP